MNAFEIVGVQPGATPEEIKRAYRAKARQLHPDTNKEPDAEARMKELNEAYDQIKDGRQPQAKRQHYSPDDMFRHMQEQFHAQFAEHERRRKNTVQVEITLEEAFTGKTVTVSGFTIVLPKGIDQGHILRVPGKAKDGGDLYVAVQIASHAVFERHGEHLAMLASVDPLSAVLGSEMTVTGIDGKEIKVVIPPNAKAGQQVISPYNGMPASDTARGHLVLVVAIEDMILTPSQRVVLAKAREEILNR